MDHRTAEETQREPATPAADAQKRAWRTPEIVDVGDARDLTEGIVENVNDSPGGGGGKTYRP